MIRILADQDVWKETVDLLKEWGHDVVTAREVGMSNASDFELLAKAEQDRRVFITRDSDFGSLVFLGRVPSEGVILLRITPETKLRVHAELALVLDKHTEEELRRCFFTVEADRHRMRFIP
jgi:predicted nuclease of predicted toxin-antitoxin system